MWHTLFIAVHAVTGGIAVLAGCVTIGRRALFGTYLWSLVAMEVSLVLAIAAEWTVIDVPARVLFAAFALLGLVLLGRADQARRIHPSGPAGPSASYVAHLGFTLVALSDAFIVILVLNLGAPGWLVAAAGILIAVAGHFVLRAVHERLVGSTVDQREVSDRVSRPHSADSAGNEVPTTPLNAPTRGGAVVGGQASSPRGAGTLRSGARRPGR